MKNETPLDAANKWANKKTQELKGSDQNVYIMIWTGDNITPIGATIGGHPITLTEGGQLGVRMEDSGQHVTMVGESISFGNNLGEKGNGHIMGIISNLDNLISPNNIHVLPYNPAEPNTTNVIGTPEPTEQAVYQITQ